MTPRLTLTRALAVLAVAVLAVAGALLDLGCGTGGSAADDGSLRVFATATFLADIAQNVAGDRFTVGSLVPRDADLHAYEPTTRDVARVSEADLFILNGGGLEGTLEDTLRSSASDTTFVSASDGLTPRTPQPGEPLAADDGEAAQGRAVDPHYWLDPTLTIGYVETIRDAFAKADPAGADEYAANAAAYIEKLRDLDAWIEEQVAELPPEDRLLVMNHVSHGYYADRYGFRIVGAVIPSVATGATPTAKQLAALTAAIRRNHVRAVFVEPAENPRLADQIAAETGVAVVADLRDHALSEPGGEAATYLAMMKYDTERIVAVLER